VTIGELFKGAYRSRAREHHLRNIEERILPAVTVCRRTRHLAGLGTRSFAHPPLTIWS